MRMVFRSKMGVLLLFACLAVIAALGWYCLMGFSEKEEAMDGTFVWAPAFPAADV